MSAPDDPGFSEAHVRAILGRAIEVDARAPTVNRDDLYGVAAELGITPGTRRDPAIVRSAQHSAMGWVRVRRTGRGGYSGGHGRGGASLADHYYASHRRMGGLDNRRGRGGGRDPESASSDLINRSGDEARGVLAPVRRGLLRLASSVMSRLTSLFRIVSPRGGMDPEGAPQTPCGDA
jgi:hypothetical protein